MKFVEFMKKYSMIFLLKLSKVVGISMIWVAEYAIKGGDVLVRVGTDDPPPPPIGTDDPPPPPGP